MFDTPHSVQRATLFYGWYVLAACFLILFFNTGARLSFGVLLKPMATDFGWERGAVSAAFFVNMAVFAFSLVVIGKLYDRYGPKWVIIGSTLFLTAGYILTSCVQSLWQFLLGYGVVAAIGLGGTSVPIVATLMSKWFVKQRGLAVSLALCGGSLGQFVLLPLITTFTLRYDWRLAYLGMGVLMLLVNVPLVLWVIRGDPEALGMQPYGEQNDNDGAAGQPLDRTEDLSSDVSLNLRLAMRTPSFWLFLGVMFVCGGGDFLVATHLVPLVTDHGISATTGSQMLALYGLMSLVGLLLAGPTSDRIGSKTPIAMTFLLRIVLFLLVIYAQTLTAFYLFALLFGFTHLITAPLTPILVGKLYGLSHLGVIAGIVTTMHHLAGGVWVYAGGALFDQTGGYQTAFIVSAISAGIAFICSLFIREHPHGVVPPPVH